MDILIGIICVSVGICIGFFIGYKIAENTLIYKAVEISTKELPSTQPEVIWCKDCIYQTESWSGIKYCEAHGDHIGKDYDYCSNARRRGEQE